MTDTLLRPHVLQRRFARLDELPTLWRSSDAPEPELLHGDIGHLPEEQQEAIRRNTAKPINLPAAYMSWTKFALNVMPDADKIELFLPLGVGGAGRGAFTALTTAVDPDAPPVLLWDRRQQRNQVGWYVYPDGSTADRWRLSGTFAKVLVVVRVPSRWGAWAPSGAQDGVILVLEGAVDLNDDAGLGLTVDEVRPEWHELMAADGADLRMQGVFDASACGWLLMPYEAFAWPVNLRTLNPTGWTVYQIDRWD